MMNSKSEELISGLTTAFIDQSSNSNLAYRPEFIYNDYKQGKKVLVSLEQELKRCDEFFIRCCCHSQCKLWSKVIHNLFITIC